MRTKLIISNADYKEATDLHRCCQIFHPGDLIMVHMRKECFPVGTYAKLSSRKFGPIPIVQRINENAYIAELPPHIHASATFNVADITAYYPPDYATIHMDTESSGVGVT